ncbi:hypothetical protein AB0K80_02895 [Streptomyces sp. NPDC052682]|uniref:hypothetical protein n=1 Tax=Streptomyces sp. NPDC052682 TaxID=3154954 RepID=UPI00344587C4
MGRAVKMGTYTYIPAPPRSPATADGTLTKDGRLITLTTTEPILRDFLDALRSLEDDLGRRWMSATGLPTFARAE